MILVLQTSKPNYRLRSYLDFVERFPKHYDDVKFYGPWFADWVDPPSHVIPAFHEGWTMDQVIDKYVGKEPEALFLFSSSALKKFGRTDFNKFSCKQFLLFTDAVSWDDDRVAAMSMHAMKPFTAVLHNYMHKLEELKSKVPAERFVHYPCWAAHCYDAEANPSSKDLEFLISGVPGGDEYTHRDIFAKAVAGAGLSAQARLGDRTNEKDDNDRFCRDLLRSKYSPHDGGVNGRMVPRYPESCFARSVIVSPDLGPEMRANGYEHDKNCILFDRSKYGPVESLRLLEETGARRDWADLAGNAYELARSRHCTDARIRQFLELAL